MKKKMNKTCACLYEKAEEMKQVGGYEEVFPPIEMFSGRAYVTFTVKEHGKKKEKQVPMFLLKCPICGKPYAQSRTV